MRKKPTILHTETLARTRLFHIQQLDLRFDNGVEVRYERLLSSPQGAVLVVPINDNNEVIMIREYAAGSESYELSLPKGRIEQGEAVLAAANREIQEEIGFGARDLQQLTSLTVAPGYMAHQTHIVLARDLYAHKLEGDEPEEIEVVPWPLASIDELVAREDVTEARTIAALYMTKVFLQRV